MKFKYSGAWPALVTPYGRDGKINLTVLKELVEYLIREKKVDGLYACGSTAQGLMLSLIEREQIAETVFAQANGRVPVIVHVGSLVLPDAVRLACHAADHGAAGVSSITPPLYPDERSLAAYYRVLAGSVPDTPFFPYFFGGGWDFVSLVKRLADLPNLAGAKYTGPNLFELSGLLQLRQENWFVFSGMDEECAYAAMAGTRGNIGSTLNHYPGVYKAIHACIRVGDLAQAVALQQSADRATRAMFKAGFLPALWEALRVIGFECGEPRLPARGLSPEEAAVLRADLAEAEYGDLVKM